MESQGGGSFIKQKDRKLLTLFCLRAEKWPSRSIRRDGHFCKETYERKIIMEFDKDGTDDLLKILRTERELDEAIKKQGFIDLAPFCPPPESVSQPPSRSQQ